MGPWVMISAGWYKAALKIFAISIVVECIRLFRPAAVQTIVRMITGVMLALPVGVAIKLKIFGGSP